MSAEKLIIYNKSSLNTYELQEIHEFPQVQYPRVSVSSSPHSFSSTEFAFVFCSRDEYIFLGLMLQVEWQREKKR